MGQIIRFLIICLFLFYGIQANAGIPEIKDTEIENVVYKFIDPLVKAAEIDDDRVRIHIMGVDEFNAFVSSGEDIYIYVGLIVRIKNPDEFQSVIAHELSHMIGGHYHILSSRIKKEMANMVVMQVLGIAMMLGGGNSVENAGAGIIMGGQNFAQQNLLSFSRDEERLADVGALNLMKKLGISYQSFIDVLSFSRDNNLMSENRINAYMINHPLVEERIRNINEWVKDNKYKIKKKTKKDVEDYLMIRAKLIGYLFPKERVISYFPDNDTMESYYANAILNMREKKYEQSKKIINEKLLKKYPKNPYFHELLGDVFYQIGDFKSAISEYKISLENLDKNIDPSQIELNLSLAMIAEGGKQNIQMANEYAKKVLLKDSKSVIAYRVLAGVNQIWERQGEYNYYMAEYYNLLGNKSLAKAFAKKALKFLKENTPEYIKTKDLLLIE